MPTEKWSLPASGWKKANIDAALKHGQAVVVVRDEGGKILLVNSSLFYCMSFHKVKVKTLD